MTQEQQQIELSDDEFAGSFVEAALTTDQVTQAIAEEERLGIRDGVCTFLAAESAIQSV